MIWLLIGYMILFIHRPFEIWPFLGDIKLERVYVLVTLGFALLSGRLRPTISVLHLAVAGFALAILLSWILSPWAREADATDAVTNWSKILVFYLLVVSLVHDRDAFFILLIGFLFAVGLFVSHSVYEYHHGRHGFSMGVRRLEGINTTLRHANAFATTALIAIPINVAILRLSRAPIIRFAAVGYIAVAVYGVVMSSSRTGIIGMAFLAGVYVIQSQYRFRIMALILAGCIIAWPMLDPSKQTRILSIWDSSVGPANAQTSAESRTESLWIGVDLWQEYPLTGVGPGAWISASGSALVSHNLYGQVIGELGTIGALSFAFLVLVGLNGSISLIRRSRHFGHPDDHRFYKEIGIALLVMQLLMLLFGMAGGSLFRFFWIWHAAFVVVATLVVKFDYDEIDPETEYLDLEDGEGLESQEVLERGYA